MKWIAEEEQNNGPVHVAGQPTRAESFFAMTKSLILRALIIYFISTMFRRPQAPTGTSQGSTGLAPSTNLYANGTMMDLHIYVSENSETPDFKDPSSLIWTENGILYGDWYGGVSKDGIFAFETEIDIPEAVMNNGTIYLHAYIVRAGSSPDPSAGKESYSRKYTVHRTKQLNRYRKRKYSRTTNLLTGETSATEEEIKKAETIKEETVSYWHPNLTLNMVYDYTAWTSGAVPPPLDEFIEFLPTGEYYKPILYVNDYWNLAKDYQPINATLKRAPLRLTFQPLSMLKFQMYSAQTMRSKWSVNSLLGDKAEDEDLEQDSLKEALLDTNPYLLGITFAVSIVHSVFEFLAFKNDIQFWKNRKSLEGLSVRSVFFNVFQSVVVLLYVLDNETNTLIRISCGVGLLIELWKIKKVVDVSFDFENPILGICPRLVLKDKSSYVESQTRQYDQMAFRYLSWALYPLLIGYAVYSLIYEEHKGWYSWVLNMMYGFLLTFGFIMMTPQLFINYKLKSVAHLPWRMLTYKALNTFVDDLFSFVIRMPTLYRIGCFRDDIVFFIFLYQRYIYRVDPARVNEYGYSKEMEGKEPITAEGNVANAVEGTETKSITDKKKD
nr:EOG090X032C [Lepidurus arcticus]